MCVPCQTTFSRQKEVVPHLLAGIADPNDTKHTISSAQILGITVRNVRGHKWIEKGYEQMLDDPFTTLQWLTTEYLLNPDIEL